ncbi:MAG TPA: hypothetical protein DD990_03035, partial [Cyanobacteria bacterium UBA11368]|nr:hypothetical protein [Cyanobacteria bacterium UBA11368]
RQIANVWLDFWQDANMFGEGDLAGTRHSNIFRLVTKLIYAVSLPVLIFSTPAANWDASAFFTG